MSWPLKEKKRQLRRERERERERERKTRQQQQHKKKKKKRYRSMPGSISDYRGGGGGGGGAKDGSDYHRDHRSSWSGAISELRSSGGAGTHVPPANVKTPTKSNWKNIKRSPLDIQTIKPELEGLRNSEHTLSRILNNLSYGSKKRARRLHRKSIIDIRKNEKILQVEWKRRYWDLFVCFFIFVYNIVTPYRIGFFDSTYRGSSGVVFAYERITELVYILDVIFWYWDVFLLIAKRWLPFLSNEMSSSHKIKSVNINENIPYLTLSVDTISLLPLEPLVMLACRSSHKCKGFAKCLPLVRMLRTFTVIISQKRYEKHLLHINVISVENFQLLANTLLLVILVHSSACIWWLTFALEGYPEDGWDNFVSKFELMSSPTSNRYTAALYWSTQTMTTIGFGDITPSTIPELSVSIMVMIVGAVTFAYFVGKMSANVQDANKASSRFHQCMRELNEFMVQRQLPPSMQTKIRAFFQYRHLSGKWGFDENALLREMSPTMRAAVILYNNKDAIRRVPWFADGEPDFLFRICACLHTIYCAPGELLIREGELGQEMYLLIKGQVEIFNQTGTFHTVMEAADASEAKYFGEVSALFGDRRLASVKALSFLDVLSITKQDLDAVLDYFPALKMRITKEGSRRRRRRIYAKVLAVVRLMNLGSKKNKRINADWTVEDLLNLKVSLANNKAIQIIDPTLNEISNMSLGHINEISSVGNLSSVGGKSRRSSIASIKDIADKDFLEDIRMSSMSAGGSFHRSMSDKVQHSNNSFEGAGSFGDYVEGGEKKKSATVHGGMIFANRSRPHSPKLTLNPKRAESPFSPKAALSKKVSLDEKEMLLLGSFETMLASFKQELVGSLDKRYAPLNKSTSSESEIVPSLMPSTSLDLDEPIEDEGPKQAEEDGKASASGTNVSKKEKKKKKQSKR